MIKNLFYILTGIYINQECNNIMPNIKDHLSYIKTIMLNRIEYPNYTKDKDIYERCPIINYILKNKTY